MRKLAINPTIGEMLALDCAPGASSGFRIEHEEEQTLLLFDSARGIREVRELIREYLYREEDVSLQIQMSCIESLLSSALRPRDLSPDAAYKRVVRRSKNRFWVREE